MLLAGKTLLVSGVGPGLGREIAAAALRDGANVVLGARTADKLATIAAELDPSGKQVAHLATDIGQPAQVEALVALAESQFGGLDAVVNCAARDTVMGGLEATSDADWRDVFEVNVFGTMNVVRAALPALKKQGGAIVFIGSQTMMKPPSQVIQLAYAASKGALMSAMYHLAHELGPHHIRVNTVVPSWMWGPPVEAYVRYAAQQQKTTPELVRAELTKDFPLRDMASDGDVAEAVVFLASDRARAITGQSLLVNAGEMMR